MRHLHILWALCVAAFILPVASCFNDNNNPPPPPSFDASFVVDSSLNLPDGVSLDGFQAVSLPPLYTVSVVINGLQGSGLTIEGAAMYDAASGTEDIQVPSGASSVTFPTPVPAGTQYSVSVVGQPTQPSQTCTVQPGTGMGTITAHSGDAAIQVATVNCTTNLYNVGGTVSGLLGTHLLLQNGSDVLPISTDGSFKFPTQVASGGTYQVTVAANPVGISQICTIAMGTDAGTVVDHDITNVSVTCDTNTFAVGGTVSGLTGTGLVLEDNNGSDLTITGNGAFTFVSKVSSGSPYNVTVKTEPSGPAQNCTVSGGQGTVGTSAVKSVVVNCGTNSFTVGGAVAGLVSPGLVLQNGAATLSISGNGSFAFPPQSSGSPYDVSVLTQPMGQTCSVTGGTGTVQSVNVTTVGVTCASMGSFFVGGTVSGFPTSGSMVLTNNGSDKVTVTANGAFEFPMPLMDGASYNVSVLTQPSDRTCIVTNATGAIMGGDVNTVVVRCAFTVSVNVSGLTSSGLVVNNNDTDNLNISGNGTFQFPTQVPGGGTYDVTISQQPAMDTCSVSRINGAGTVNGDVTADVTCAQVEPVSVTVTLTGCGPFNVNVSIQDTITDSSVTAVTADFQNDGGPLSHTYQIPPLVQVGSSYTIQIQSNNGSWNCVMDAAADGGTVSGTMGNAPVVLTATCACNG